MPDFPSGEYTQADVARFLKGLGGAHLDCKEKLTAILAIIDKTKIGAETAVKSRR